MSSDCCINAKYGDLQRRLLAEKNPPNRSVLKCFNVKRVKRPGGEGFSPFPQRQQREVRGRLCESAAQQSQTAVTAYLKSKQLLSFGFASSEDLFC